MKQTGKEGGGGMSEIRTAMRKSPNTSQNKHSLQTIFQNNISCVKK
jgi:hypothetical protein